MKKFASLTLAVLLACALACPALAAGAGALYPAEIVESTEGGYSRLEKIYHLTAADDPADIPTADFEREGYQYTLLDLTRTDKAETDTKRFKPEVRKRASCAKGYGNPRRAGKDRPARSVRHETENGCASGPAPRPCGKAEVQSLCPSG